MSISADEKEAIVKRLLTYSQKDWKKILEKCHTHIKFKLFKKQQHGAHCEQRLGMPALDFYTGNAVKAIYGFEWRWKFELFTLEEQLIRIIDSMISKEVEKYKSEIRRGRQTYLVDPEQIGLFAGAIQVEEESLDLSHFSTALNEVCNENPMYRQFILLKKQNNSYEQIAEKLGIARKESYRLRETIARKATKALKSLF